MLEVSALVAAVKKIPIRRGDVCSAFCAENHTRLSYLAPLLADFFPLFLIQRTQKILKIFELSVRGGQRSTRSDKRGGHSLQRRAAPSQDSPLGGQRSTRSDKRGGHSLQRRAAPSQDSPLGGQRSTRSDKRGGHILPMELNGMSQHQACFSAGGNIGVVAEQQMQR